MHKRWGEGNVPPNLRKVCLFVSCTPSIPECTRASIGSAELRGTWEVYFNPREKYIKDVLALARWPSSLKLSPVHQ